MELDKAIQKRHSVRKFKDKKPDWRTIIECIDSARYAPMAGSINTLKFILVDDEKKIEKIAEASQQPFISQAKFLVVLCSTPSRTEKTYGEKARAWVKQQAGAAIQNFLLMIEEAGLATCWVGYLDEPSIKEELSVPEDAEIEAIFPVGYEYSKPATRKAKIDLDRILYFNKYGNVHMRKERKTY
jgi:nitroreductase